MTSSTWTRALLAALAAGSALTLAGACGLGGGNGPAFRHATKFLVTGSHQGFTCDQCHDPAASSYALAGGGVTCLGCHQDADVTPGHSGVAGYTWSDASCIACHWDGKTAQFDHSKNFPIASGTPHQNIACADCHGPTRAVANLKCVTCHTHSDQAALATTHTGVTGYAYDSPACYGCHKDGAGALPSNHDAQLFPITGTKHQGVGCAQCHGATKAVTALTCTPCHDQATMATKHSAIPASTTGGRPAGIGATRTSYQYLSTSCVRCHADGQVDRIAHHPSYGRRLQQSSAIAPSA